MATPLDLGRFTEPTDAELSPEQRAAKEQLLSGARASVPPPYRIWLTSPEVVRRIEGLGHFLLHGSSLNSRENEIAILATARHLNCAFVLSAHARAARRAGLDEPVIEALIHGNEPTLPAARERTVYDVTRALASGPPEDGLYRRAVELLGLAGASELTALIGYYTAVCSILNFHNVPALRSEPG